VEIKTGKLNTTRFVMGDAGTESRFRTRELKSSSVSFIPISCQFSSHFFLPIFLSVISELPRLFFASLPSFLSTLISHHSAALPIHLTGFFLGGGALQASTVK